MVRTPGQIQAEEKVTEPIMGKVFHLVLDSGVDRVLTLEQFRVNELTRSVKKILQSEGWLDLTGYEYSPNDLSIIWFVANQLIAKGTVKYADSKHQRFIRSIANGTYTKIGAQLFGENFGLLRRWSACLVVLLVNEQYEGRVNFEPVNRERIIQLAYAVEMVAQLTFKDSEVADLPMFGKSF